MLLRWIIITVLGIFTGFFLYYYYFSKTSSSMLDNEPETYERPVIFHSVLSPKECQHIIDISKSKLRPAMVRNFKTDHRNRNNSVAWLQNDEPIVNKIKTKLSKMLNHPMECMEHIQVGFYKENQYFNEHYDQCHSNTSWCKKMWARKQGGKRLKTAIIYLNDDYEGGYTNFVMLNKKFKPPVGSMIFFHNLNKSQTKVHLHAKHKGEVITKGKKWILSVWLREYKKQ